MKVGASGNTGDLTTGVGLGSVAGGDVSGPLPGGLVVEGIQGIPVSAAAPADRDALIFDGYTGEWIPDHVEADDVDYDDTITALGVSDVQAAIEALAASGGGGVTDADYLVGTAHAGLSAEIVVGATPGGELGGTWASPTVDATHSGSAHADLIAESLLTTRGDLIRRGATEPERVALGTAGQHVGSDGTDALWQDDLKGLVAIIDGGGSVITAGGPKGFYVVPFACTITAWDLEGDVSATATVDVKKRAHGGGAASSIVGAGTKPNLSAATETHSTTLTSWTTSISAGDHLYFHVDANDNAAILSLTLWVKKA